LQLKFKSVFGVHRAMIGAVAMLTTTVSSTAGEGRPAEPLAIFATQFPWRDGAFSLEVSPDGRAEFRGRNGVNRWTLTAQEMGGLERLVAEQRVLDLGSEYGTCYIDGLLRVMKVELGARTVRLSLCSLEAGTMSAAQREEARRALRLWVAVRNLFPDRYAVDDRADDDAFLE
jgi:hypothetical protein